MAYWQSEAAHYPAVIDDHDSKDRYHLIYDDGYVHGTLFFTGCCNHGILSRCSGTKIEIAHLLCCMLNIVGTLLACHCCLNALYTHMLACLSLVSHLPQSSLVSVHVSARAMKVHSTLVDLPCSLCFAVPCNLLYPCAPPLMCSAEQPYSESQPLTPNP